MRRMSLFLVNVYLRNNQEMVWLVIYNLSYRWKKYVLIATLEE